MDFHGIQLQTDRSGIYEHMQVWHLTKLPRAGVSPFI